METETRVALSQPVKYAAADGTMRAAGFLTIRAPSSRAYRLVAKIKPTFLRAIIAAQAATPVAATKADAAPAADEKPTPADVVMMLASSDIDLAGLYDDVREIILRFGLARLDGEVALTETLAEGLSIGDFETMVGAYLATFPLAT